MPSICNYQHGSIRVFFCPLHLHCCLAEARAGNLNLDKKGKVHGWLYMHESNHMYMAIVQAYIHMPCMQIVVPCWNLMYVYKTLI